MLKLVLLVPGLLLFALKPQAPTPPDSSPVHKSSPESLAKARKVYAYDCAMCHGAAGDGKGDLVADMKLTLKDYTDPAALNGMTDQQLFTIIHDGKDKMPGEGDRLKPEDTWAMVSLVHSFAKK
jgi:mono/diheme cytochrome c family protein